MNRAQKGSEFERSICKLLSKWWTEGKRDDVFWRSSQSGGRATQRAKKGMRTYGSYGDIAAVDPIGEPLLRMFTIELKRGSSYRSAGDLLDFGDKNSKHPWVRCLLQALEAQDRAGTKGWMMICKRDRREAVVYLPQVIAYRLLPSLVPSPRCTFQLPVEGRAFISFVGIPLQTFLLIVTPQEIINQLQHS